MAVAENIRKILSQASFIRQMFEKGAALKKTYGPASVYDFSLGNPEMPPPSFFTESLVREAAKENLHRYMPNAGYPDVRENVAAYVSSRQSVPLTAENIIMTCGAGGALNAVLKTILDPNDKVLAPLPVFVEYGFYTSNHGAVFDTFGCAYDFQPDPVALEKALTPSVKAVIINSPNNPSGAVYCENVLKKIATVLKKKSSEYGHTIYIVSDQPYDRIVYDDVTVPPLFQIYPHTVICTSFSKDFSIPGERIGYAAVSPECDDKDNLIKGIVFCNRTLGYVNAPALMQRAVSSVLEHPVDVSGYQSKRNLLYDGLKKAGYEVMKPEGTFYIFPKAPGGDDIAFAEKLLDMKVLVVPGTGFKMPGYFRISYCVSDDVISGSLTLFEKAIKEFV